jgi:hypothetical protein
MESLFRSLVVVMLKGEPEAGDHERAQAEVIRQSECAAEEKPVADVERKRGRSRR